MMMRQQDRGSCRAAAAAIGVAFGIIFGAAFAEAAPSADAGNGERLAQRWCASCHAVSATQTRAASDAPAFSAIAGRENFNAAVVALFLLAPHPLMPDMNLTRNEAADLAAYIAAQKK